MTGASPDPSARPRAPRIAYVTSSRGVGGAEELIAALLPAGQQRGWEQIVLNPFADAGSVALRERCAPVAYEAHACDGARQLPAARRWLARRLDELRPDIVHVMLFHATALTATIRRRPGEVRLVTHAYGEALKQLSHPGARVRLDRWAVRRFDHVSAISQAVERFLVREHGCPPPPLGRIRLGWSGRPHPRPPAAGRPPTIVCVAVLRREKGHDTLLRAFARVRTAIPHARLVLVGGGPHRPQVEQLVQELGLTDGVQLTGRVEEIWPYLADADVYALASPSEALGISIMEAMAAGLPVVAGNVGGIPELVTPGVTGELFHPPDHEELARKLVAVLGAAPERLQAMSGAAREAAAAMRMEQSLEEYIGLYDRLLEDAAGRGPRAGGPPASHRPTR